MKYFYLEGQVPEICTCNGWPTLFRKISSAWIISVWLMKIILFFFSCFLICLIMVELYSILVLRAAEAFRTRPLGQGLKSAQLRPQHLVITPAFPIIPEPSGWPLITAEHFIVFKQVIILRVFIIDEFRKTIALRSLSRWSALLEGGVSLLRSTCIIKKRMLKRTNQGQRTSHPHWL